MIIDYRSQAGQDRFVFEMLVKRKGCEYGRFLDIGCCEPIKLSNTYALEQLGWRGLLFDMDPNAIKQCREVRQGPVIHADTTAFDWDGVPDKAFDYLSLDVDSATLATLTALLKADIKFRVATIEHDSYRFGIIPRDTMRQLLTDAGYHLYIANVAHNGCPFEDWWVHPSLKDTKFDTSWIETAAPTL